MFPLEEGITSIGRAQENTIVLDDTLVSRTHAEVRFEGSKIVIKDIGGKNPVRVNGEQIEERSLSHGDSIAIGGVEMVFENPIPRSLRVVKDGVLIPARLHLGAEHFEEIRNQKGLITLCYSPRLAQWAEDGPVYLQAWQFAPTAANEAPAEPCRSEQG